MATSVVAGRVDEQVRRAAEASLRAAGITVSDIIGRLMEHIAATGEIPSFQEQDDGLESESAVNEFFSFIDSLPPAPDWLVEMDDRSMQEMIASRYV